MDEQMLVEAFRRSRAADRMRVPRMATIIARAAHAKEMQYRRQFTAIVALASGLAGACTFALILLTPREFPLPMSPEIVPLLVIVGGILLWGTGVGEMRVDAGR